MEKQSATLGVPREPERPVSTASTLRGEDLSQEKKQQDDGTTTDGEATLDGTEDEVDLSEYPTGLKMFFIVLALVLSIFLVALDMVRYPIPLTRNIIC